ncbi:hypothetical protein PI126_g16702 [Phytophthora idaei]|nr:hypothetical protein PI126_g16702 [Phytophthora idaei]
MLDGWTHGSEHYLAVFGCYEISAPPRHPLFSLAPIVVDGSGRLDAEIHMAALEAFLPFFLTCRLNLAVRTLLDPHHKKKEPQQVQSLMKQLRALAQAANLRLKTSLRPKLHRQTRWGRPANRRLKALLAEMGDIESISTKLQSEELNLLGARDLLELPAGDQAKFTNYLAPSVDIVHSTRI